MKEIMHIIDHAQMTDGARALTIRIFEILAEAESRAHGVPADQVHFHEVGAVDSIVDIVSAAVCLDNLGVTEVIVPALSEGTGTVRCQHGIIPVPVPAVVNITAAHGIALERTGVQGELVTPTGAAIVAAARTSTQLPKRYVVEKIGLGAGKRQYALPGILRAMLIRDTTAENESGVSEKLESRATDRRDVVWKLETNIDDSTGEQLGHCMEMLLAAGARDVHYIPIFMKKNRPAYELVVLCDEEKIPVMESIIFKETTSIGIRRAAMERTLLPRTEMTVKTPYGTGQAKVCTLPDGTKRCYPEYESARKLALDAGISLAEAMEALKGAAL